VGFIARGLVIGVCDLLKSSRISLLLLAVLVPLPLKLPEFVTVGKLLTLGLADGVSWHAGSISMIGRARSGCSWPSAVEGSEARRGRIGAFEALLLLVLVRTESPDKVISEEQTDESSTNLIDEDVCEESREAASES